VPGDRPTVGDADANGSPDGTAGSVPGGDGPDSRTREQITQLTYAGEEPTATLPVRDGILVATTHRLLVYTPDGDGAVLQTVEAPNVTGLGYARLGNGRWRPALVAFAVGVASLLVGQTVSVEPPSVAVADSPVAGGGLDAVTETIRLVGLLDELATVVGVGALLVAAGLLASDGISRDAQVVVRVAGEDPLAVPAGETDATTVESFAASVGVDYSPPSFRSS
jgi:hypothetical protein